MAGVQPGPGKAHHKGTKELKLNTAINSDIYVKMARVEPATLRLITEQIFLTQFFGLKGIERIWKLVSAE